MRKLYCTLVLGLIAAPLFWAYEPSASCVEEEAKEERAWTARFDKAQMGAVPEGWICAETNGRGKPATWKVVEDASAPGKGKAFGIVSTKNIGRTYNIAFTKKPRLKNLEIEVKFKAVTGKEDQGGGPIWRVQDVNNYYIARANPLESNFRVYVVKNGNRRQLDSARVKTKAGLWYTIKMVHEGNRIVGYLDGKKMLEVSDNTIPELGGVGLWTKADAATSFDDLKVRNLER